MLKMIITGLLGLFTLPIVGLAICAVAVIGEWVGGFGMEPQHYWAGFFIPIAAAALFACTLPFWAL